MHELVLNLSKECKEFVIPPAPAEEYTRLRIFIENKVVYDEYYEINTYPIRTNYIWEDTPASPYQVRFLWGE